ncbi:MAG: endolytic transglycosylase MltG [Persephonella sp.]|nr:endolytic transglycosylase MltG [Persephonella sp.]
MKRFLIFFAFVPVFMVILFFVELNRKYHIRATYVEIKKGSSIKEISHILEKKGIIRNNAVFLLYSKIKGKSLKKGYYLFEGSLSIKDVWEVLYKGREKLFPFTIIPGDDLIDIGKKLERKGFLKKEVFYHYVFKKDNLKKFHLQGISFEGYFPPETYYLRKNPDVEYVVKTFLNEFNRRYLPLLQKKRLTELSLYKVMIIASLVEKETAMAEEKPVIAGVIINRLKKRMKLQIDPTVIYALKLSGLWKGKLTKKMLKFDSLYNTYIYPGLPPTPISSFSLETLKAVLNYKKTDYLYFFTKDGKKHIFSKTYREHLKKMIKSFP